MFYFTGIRLLRPLARLLFRVRVIGAGHIPAEGPVVLCSNHKSVCDPYFLAMRCPRQIRYMAKSELFEEHGPLARRLLYALGAFPVTRDSGDVASVRTALSVLRQGGVCGIFPQGRCVYENGPVEIKAGVALIAWRAKAQIVPACVYCEGRVRPFCRVTVRFGRPFACGEGRDYAAAAGRIAARIDELLEEGH